MRLNINLATKPYLDVRRVLLQWGSLVLLLAVVTCALIWLAVTNWRASREMQVKIDRLNSEIAALQRQHDSSVALLQASQNKPVVTESRFLNGLIARKSFSWTRAFMQLEEILPAGLHVMSISPALQPLTNTIEMHLTVGGTERDAAVELVKRLEQSPAFRNARIEEEKAIGEKGSTDTVMFHLAAIYVPLTGKTAGNKLAETKHQDTAATDAGRGETRTASPGAGTRTHSSKTADNKTADKSKATHANAATGNGNPAAKPSAAASIATPAAQGGAQ